MQERPARFVTGNHTHERHSWTFKMGIGNNYLYLLYNGRKGKASLPTDDLIPLTSSGSNHHSMAFQNPIAGTHIYRGS